MAKNTADEEGRTKVGGVEAGRLRAEFYRREKVCFHSANPAPTARQAGLTPTLEPRLRNVAPLFAPNISFASNFYRFQKSEQFCMRWGKRNASKSKTDKQKEKERRKTRETLCPSSICDASDNGGRLLLLKCFQDATASLNLLVLCSMPVSPLCKVVYNQRLCAVGLFSKQDDILLIKAYQPSSDRSVVQSML
jgi:hypothetical protein